jgi:hypothetical protein
MGPAVLHGEELRVETGQLADIAILDRTRFRVARDLPAPTLGRVTGVRLLVGAAARPESNVSVAAEVQRIELPVLSSRRRPLLEPGSRPGDRVTPAALSRLRAWWSERRWFGSTSKRRSSRAPR